MIYPKLISKISSLSQLSDEEKKTLEKVTNVYPFRANEYYLSLIDWNDPNDPIRKLIIPDINEIEEKWGDLDPSGEADYTVMEGVEHKYDSVVLFLLSNICYGVCRYCFRKRLFNYNKKDYLKERDYDKAIQYVKEHPEINNVLLTGGDPLVIHTDKLEYIISKLFEIPHVKIVRIGTRMPQFYPFRISEDEKLLELIKRFSKYNRRIYVVNHFVHPKEITPEAVECIQKLIEAGAILCNQTPLIRGISDNIEDLRELFNTLSYIGCPPYYVFQCRPAKGNKIFAVPIEKGYEIFEKAKDKCAGLAKRARYAMSHRTGKLEILALTKDNIIFKYHRAAKNENVGKVVVAKRNPEAYWFDDYEVINEYPLY